MGLEFHRHHYVTLRLPGSYSVTADNSGNGNAMACSGVLPGARTASFRLQKSLK